MGFGTLPALPCNFLWLPDRSKKTCRILCKFTNVVGIQRPIWGSKGLVDPTYNSTHFLTTFKGSSSSVISASSSQLASSSQSASSSQPSSTNQSAGRGKTYCPERSRASARGGPCAFTSSFLYSIFPTLFFRSEAPNYPNC